MQIQKIIESVNGMKSNARLTMQSVFVVLLLMLGFFGCRSMPQRDIAIIQINKAEQKLQNANTAEANIYMSDKYMEATTLLRRARNSMQSEEYSQSTDLAQRSQEVALEAIQQTSDERKNVKALAVRLLFSANEAWESYAQSHDKEYASDELIAIRKLLDSAQEDIDTKEYMVAFKKAQRAHGEISKLPEAVEKGRIIRLEEEKKRLKAQKTADQIIAAANQQAENIVAAAKSQREQVLAETAELAAYARQVEFERMFPSTYLVKRSETLIDIARRHEIYNDQFMWPLLYKANRDQIRDPKVVFPDQVLTIPRDITNADIIEARKMAEAAPPYDPPPTAYNPEVYQRYMQILPPPQFISGQEAVPELVP
jgi:LysM domain